MTEQASQEGFVNLGKTIIDNPSARTVVVGRQVDTFVWRIASNTRRRAQENKSHILSCTVRGGREFSLDTSSGNVLAAPNLPVVHDLVSFTPTEKQLAVRLMQSQGVTLSRRQLAEAVDPEHPDFVRDKTINANIDRIRRKINDPNGAAGPAFEGVFGFGYRCTEPRRSPAELLQMIADFGAPDHLIHRVVKGGDLVIDTSSGDVLVAPYLDLGEEGEQVSLTLHETRIAEELMQKQGVTVSRRHLAVVLDPEHPDFVSDGTIRVRVSVLNAKLNEPQTVDSPSFESVRGGGYRCTEGTAA